jgi:DNA-binding SARP family transcriptional activator
VEFRILGPLDVRDGEREVALGGARQRALLALLLVHENAAVSADRLLTDVWDGNGSIKALQIAVSRLRRALGDAGRLLETSTSGYRLRLEPSQFDLRRFQATVNEARRELAAGRADTAAEQLHAALAMWRGTPLADVAYQSWAQTEIARLEDLRLAALEDRIDADLALGRHAALTGELEQLVEQHPYRERLWAARMLALYRSGRQAEALEVYRHARGVLVGELGIEPSRALKGL